MAEEGRFDATRLVPIDDPLDLARSLPPGEPADPWPTLRDQLDDARATLGDGDFDLVLRAMRQAIDPLLRGHPPEWPPPGPATDAGAGPPEPVAVVVRDLRATLCLSARHGGPGSTRAFVMLGRRIEAHLEDLATGGA